MSTEDNGLSLQGLAQRLEALTQRLEAQERENERVRSENAELRRKITTLEGSDTPHRDEAPAPESSEPGEEGRMSRSRLLRNVAAASLGALAAGGMMQRDTRQAKAHHFGQDYWVNSVNAHGHVWVVSDASEGEVPTIFASQNRTGDAAVEAVNYSSGPGVESDSRYGYGGQFRGGKAQLRLVPASTRGKPTGAHSKGEIYMDSTGALFVCVIDGTPGTWRKVRTAAV